MPQTSLVSVALPAALCAALLAVAPGRSEDEAKARAAALTPVVAILPACLDPACSATWETPIEPSGMNASSAGHDAVALWPKFALHALLVPLLESEGPLAWAAANELMPCLGGAEVSVDGRPLPHGRPLPIRRTVVVRFRLNDCWPLGRDGPGLWGTLEMAVRHDGRRLVAAVHPVDLSTAINGARVPLRADFVATISLVAGPKP